MPRTQEAALVHSSVRRQTIGVHIVKYKTDYWCPDCKVAWCADSCLKILQ